MNLREAYDILGVPVGTTPEDAKSKYKELAKKFHPDVNKDPDATDRFKKINEAYDALKMGKEDGVKFQTSSNPFDLFKEIYGNQGFDPFDQINGQDVLKDFFIRSRQNTNRQTNSEISQTITVSFEECVMGCKKEIKYNRMVHCDDCQAKGKILREDHCKECSGNGFTISSMEANGRIIHSQKPCIKCYGQNNFTKCKPCEGKGSTEKQITLSVKIPAGIPDGGILRLGNMGNFIIVNGMGVYGNTSLTVRVGPHKHFYLQGNDVIDHQKISLLEALKGSKKKINTLYGESEVEIPPKTKHAQQLLIKNHGVKDSSGSHVVMIHIEYPENTEELIEFLESK